MLILSRAKITLRPEKPIRIEGDWARHKIRIRQWMEDLPVKRGSISLRFGKIVFSSEFPKSLRQRVRNFLVNECAPKSA